MAVSPVDLGQGSQREVIAPNLVDVDLDRAPRRSRWYLEALVIVWLVWAYDLIANLAPIRQAAAVAHGRSILHLESVLHLDPERTLDQWLTGHQTIGLWVATYYDNAHFVVTLAVIGWLWWRHPLHYRRLRTSLVLVNVIGFVAFWLYPTAPPRMLPGAHIADVVAATGAFGSWHSGQLAHHANELAAMPSLHMAWAAWSALAAWQVLRRHHRWAPLMWAYPVATALAVLATGNHYIADVAAGLATLAVAAGGAVLLGRVAHRIPIPLATRPMARRLAADGRDEDDVLHSAHGLVVAVEQRQPGDPRGVDGFDLRAGTLPGARRGRFRGGVARRGVASPGVRELIEGVVHGHGELQAEHGGSGHERQAESGPVDQPT